MELELWIGKRHRRRGGGIVFYSASLPYRRKATAMRVLDEAIAELDRMDWLTDRSLAAGKRRLLEDDASAAVYAEERAQEIGQSRWWLGDARSAFDRGQQEQVKAHSRGRNGEGLAQSPHRAGGFGDTVDHGGDVVRQGPPQRGQV